MIILNAGIPRSGTVLTNAIIKMILDGHQVTYKSINAQPRILADILTSIVNNRLHCWRNFILHTHGWSDPVTNIVNQAGEHVLIFANKRDPRDVCLSLSKLHDLPIEDAIQLTRQSTAIYQMMIKFSKAIPFKYEDVVVDPLALVHQIASGVGLSVTETRASEIVEATSIKAHKKIMERVASPDNNEGVTLIQNSRRVLKEDTRTHISDRHIQSGKVGRWRTELSDADQANIERSLTPLAQELGYD